ncbi:UNVERIFIED_CONTAM: hypothetical protein HHA_245560 [Hammondia hammondi]|eukprot:XP_008883658.1 hypothetical protein HHA_245560 [Hammondia hammondi]
MSLASPEAVRVEASATTCPSPRTSFLSRLSVSAEETHALTAGLPLEKTLSPTEAEKTRTPSSGSGRSSSDSDASCNPSPAPLEERETKEQKGPKGEQETKAKKETKESWTSELGAPSAEREASAMAVASSGKREKSVDGTGKSDGEVVLSPEDAETSACPTSDRDLESSSRELFVEGGKGDAFCGVVSKKDCAWATEAGAERVEEDGEGEGGGEKKSAFVACENSVWGCTEPTMEDVKTHEETKEEGKKTREETTEETKEAQEETKETQEETKETQEETKETQEETNEETRKDGAKGKCREEKTAEHRGRSTSQRKGRRDAGGDREGSTPHEGENTPPPKTVGNGGEDKYREKDTLFSEEEEQKQPEKAGAPREAKEGFALSSLPSCPNNTPAQEGKAEDSGDKRRESLEVSALSEETRKKNRGGEARNSSGDGAGTQLEDTVTRERSAATEAASPRIREEMEETACPSGAEQTSAKDPKTVNDEDREKGDSAIAARTPRAEVEREKHALDEHGEASGKGQSYSVLALLGVRGDVSRPRGGKSVPQQPGNLTKATTKWQSGAEGDPRVSPFVGPSKGTEALPTAAAPSNPTAAVFSASSASVDYAALQFLTVPRVAFRATFAGQLPHQHRQGGGRSFESRDAATGGAACSASFGTHWAALPGFGASHDSGRSSASASPEGSNRHQTFSPRPHAVGPAGRSPTFVLPPTPDVQVFPGQAGLGGEKGGGKPGRGEGARPVGGAAETRERAGSEDRGLGGSHAYAALYRERDGGRGTQGQRRSSTCRGGRASPQSSGEAMESSGGPQEKALVSGRGRWTGTGAAARSCSRNDEKNSAAHLRDSVEGANAREGAVLPSSPGFLSGRKRGAGARSAAAGVALAEVHQPGDSPEGVRGASLLGAVPGRGPRAGKTRGRSESFASPSLQAPLLPVAPQKQSLASHKGAVPNPEARNRHGAASETGLRTGDSQGTRRGSLGGASGRGASTDGPEERRGWEVKVRMHRTEGGEEPKSQLTEAPLLAWQVSVQREDAGVRAAAGQQRRKGGVQGEEELGQGEGSSKSALGKTVGAQKEGDAKTRKGERERRPLPQGFGRTGEVAEERDKDERDEASERGKEHEKPRESLASALPAGSTDGSGDDQRLEESSAAEASRASGKEAVPGDKKKGSAKSRVNGSAPAARSTAVFDDRRSTASGGKDGKKEGRKKASLASAASTSKPVAASPQVEKSDSSQTTGAPGDRKRAALSTSAAASECLKTAATGASRKAGATGKRGMVKADVKPAFTRGDDQVVDRTGSVRFRRRSRTDSAGPCMHGALATDGETHGSGVLPPDSGVIGGRETASAVCASRLALLPGLQPGAAYRRRGERDVWDLPTGKPESETACEADTFFTLGDIRQAEREIEGGNMSLKQFVAEKKEKTRREEEERRQRESVEGDGRDRDANGEENAACKKSCAEWKGQEATEGKFEERNGRGRGPDKSSIAVGLGGVALQQDVEEEFSVFECEDPNVVVLPPQPSAHAFLASGLRAAASPAAMALRASMSPQQADPRAEDASENIPRGFERPATFPTRGRQDPGAKSADTSRDLPAGVFRAAFGGTPTGASGYAHSPNPAALQKSCPEVGAPERLVPQVHPFGGAADKLFFPPQKAPLDEAAGRAAGRKLMALLGVKASSLPAASSSVGIPTPVVSRPRPPTPQRVEGLTLPGSGALSFRSLLAAVEAQQTQRSHAQVPREDVQAGRQKSELLLAELGRAAVGSFSTRPTALPGSARAVGAEGSPSLAFRGAASTSVPGYSSACPPHVGHRPPSAVFHDALFSPSASGHASQRPPVGSPSTQPFEGENAGPRAFPQGQGVALFPHNLFAPATPRPAAADLLSFPGRDEEAAQVLTRWIGRGAAKPPECGAAAQREPREPAKGAPRGLSEREAKEEHARGLQLGSEGREDVPSFASFGRQPEGVCSPQIAAALALLANASAANESTAGRKREERGSDSGDRARTPHAEAAPEAALITALRAVIQNSRQQPSA